MNLTKNKNSKVDITGKWYRDQLFVTFTRTDDDLGTSRFEICLDEIDLEHFIATLMDFEHERT